MKKKNINVRPHTENSYILAVAFMFVGAHLILIVCGKRAPEISIPYQNRFILLIA
jgi:hypothetical protein